MDDTPTIESRISAEPARSGLGVEALQRDIVDNLICLQARYPEIATPHDWYMALAYAVRDRMMTRRVATTHTYVARDAKVACYLSAEFLIGPQLGNNLINLGIESNAREALQALGLDLDTLLSIEEEPGLGNGGLGRLAACYLDSLSTLEIPAIGYGIRYEFGIFDQEIRDGWQVEITDKWLQKGNPWEILRPDVAFYVNFGGRTESSTDEAGRFYVRWIPAYTVKGVACDTPIPGFHVNTCNSLRLWKSEAVESFDLQDFNAGDYYEAVHEKVLSETLSKVLYPNDEPEAGKRLRLAQQYFFVSCSLQDMLRLLALKGEPINRLPDMFTAQLNDTHPSIAVAELMRLLVDERQLPWDDAWDITQRTLAYTNHTLLPEALETWGLPLFQGLLPRLIEIIYEINRRFLDDVRQRYPGDEARIARMSLIDESGTKRVRMAHLATVGSHAINGVAALHSALLEKTVLRDFAELWPERFHNVTNGVTPRRFMMLSNPGLAKLLDEGLGEGWATDLGRLRKLSEYADDAAFQERWRNVKQANKQILADKINSATGIVVDPAALFDIQVKRIHEYKRQHLNALYIVTQYMRLRRDPQLALTPRCFVFGGKAAPGYAMAKLIIRLINGIAEVVNDDPAMNGRLKVVFFPDFNVKNAHFIYPAADLSEQISTAGKEASGTGNMKFMMNGALTIGTLDGANIEIREEVGDENFFLFGLNADEVERVKREGYRPADYADANQTLREVLELIGSGHFSRGDREMFRPLVDNLLHHDPFLVLADYAAYVARQEDVSAAWRDERRWTRMSILNTAYAGKFSSDRAVHEYCERIWNIRPVKISIERRN
ncbi:MULTISPECIES: glycogen/starch/alpha-glucan phosphorylase [Caballeronia]|jgi:starch phosphorylase|uniref:Alpha-1,4 glucan phosphorylase n=1 Tax=Caballeronia zhejiangensis TaxID=871203 RepID=A0A656Q9P7_9BURK|nr:MULTISPECIES: glycogen/starch/alpha-glucan phosphorylase [Caballeronia]EKS71226.1 glycogen/starch/alpha-glucan phosphorylase [Burkholderia sp. SJ98]KDR25230.1 maltodextrin phosphorylase [Caballeronia zhejiangensis]MDR5790609.1 glycogen/starch/alpha-glucan phosphorylase [Caballeronia sp. LP003]